MSENKAKTPEPKQERAPWIEPTVSRLNAGSAELLTGPTFDGADDS
ncbi:MAG: hypothetical protein QOG72_588 [Sphingomonadales bacterium]|jgi:hypothetical protein|nr:hypothetical protein [Sphingomonadales bacterium]